MLEKWDLEKVSLQTNLERNLPNFFFIILLDMNFESLTVKLHVLIISSMLAKFQEDQISIVMWSKIIHNKCIY